jgi:hypothetical protein
MTEDERENIMNNLQRIFCLGAFTAGTLFLVGCQSLNKAANADSVFSDEQEGTVVSVAALQSAAAAQRDPTLYPIHFNGKELNSLGEEKLEMILDCDGDGPEILYLNLPASDPLTAIRKTTLQKYLNEEDETQSVQVVVGHNPAVSAPAAPNLAAMAKLAAPQAGAAESGKDAGMGISNGTTR